MKLIKAHIKNFRLLKDLKLDFSVDKEKPLTVIRAANESGKTTAEYALMWALYGSEAVLPKKDEFTLFPADLKSKKERKVEVSVEVEFETEQQIGIQTIEKRKYRLIRSCIEYADNQDSNGRRSEKSQMYRLTNAGSDCMLEIEAKRVIENSLPQSLKNVYFTDGDSAMSFIEAAATQGVKRQRVSDAIEALLGLKDLNKTVKHLESVARKFSQEINDKSYREKLGQLNDQIGGFTEDIEQWEYDVKKLENKISVATKELKTVKVRIEEALRLGDKSELVNQIKDTKNRIDKMEENVSSQLRRLSDLISGEDLSMAFLAERAGVSMSILNDLNKENKLPKVSIPILEELLDRDFCFCGGDLSTLTMEGEKRRVEISNAIDSSRKSDAIQDVATGLFYRARSINFKAKNDSWTSNYNETCQQYQNMLVLLKKDSDRIEELNLSVSQIDDSLLQQEKVLEGQFETRLNHFHQEQSKRATQIREYSERRKDAEKERDGVEKKCKKLDSGATKLTLVRDSQKVFERIITELKQNELLRVGNEMNRIFLNMIGADPESNDLTMITKAELTREYDIRVYGHAGHKLNPDRDLNGASRRAITLAFILALTKVSEVEAPNVIDTPLGMMSGYVKQSVLVQTVKEGTQVVLFLTHDEIKGVEEILDKYAGRVYTLTNPAHYPRMLKNQPTEENAKIIRCECNHREQCLVCERKDIEVNQ